jgi:hypothetical protein
MAERPKGAVEIGEAGTALIEKMLGKKAEGVVGIRKEGKEWKVLVDVLERKAVPDAQDLLGRYELTLSEDGELLGQEQVLVRRRADRLGVEYVVPEKVEEKKK